MKEILLGNSSIISPLGFSLEDNLKHIFKSESALYRDKESHHITARIDRGNYGTVFPNHDSENFLRNVITHVFDDILNKSQIGIDHNDRFLVILSTTKGNVDYLDQDIQEESFLFSDASYLKKKYALAHQPLVISNACTSGLTAIIHAARLLQHDMYDHIVVIGYDLVSKFTMKGFECLYALSDAPCMPYDEARNGINLGEAVVGMLMSRDANRFDGIPARYHSGSIANDANHISGPSRTGEGLYRAIKQCFITGDIDSNQIGYINAHGTATVYNDEMEAQAFNRSNLNHVPLNSLKGYYGHTLGAAGLLETIIGLECMKSKRIPVSLGYENHGLTLPLNVSNEVQEPQGEYMLKTSSGFGGVNAAATFSIHG